MATAIMDIPPTIIQAIAMDTIVMDTTATATPLTTTIQTTMDMITDTVLTTTIMERESDYFIKLISFLLFDLSTHFGL